MPTNYTFEESLKAVDNNKAIDPCSSQWILLWMYAAYVGENPTNDEKKNLDVFYKTIPDFCLNQCYRKFLNNFPPKLIENRRVLMGWLQTAENSCRIQNGLKPKPFNYKELMKRWRYPDGYL